jgi:hypothetical protein
VCRLAPAMTTTKAPTNPNFQLSRLNRTASGIAVYASSGVLPRKMQNSLPAAGQALPYGIGYPQGCYERFLTLVTPELAWRKTYRFVGRTCGDRGRRSYAGSGSASLEASRGWEQEHQATQPPGPPRMILSVANESCQRRGLRVIGHFSCADGAGRL